MKDMFAGEPNGSSIVMYLIIFCPKKTLNMILCFRYPDGSVRLRNPNIELMDQDILYHLALGSESHDLVSMFGDVKVSKVQTIYIKITLETLTESMYYGKNLLE